MNTKNVPVLIMLIAGSITSIIAYIFHYPLKTMLWVLLVVLLLFYFVGCMIKNLLDAFEKENEARRREEEEKLLEEGAVVEKEAEPDEAEENDGNMVKHSAEE